MSSYYVYHLRFHHTFCKISTCAPPPEPTKLQLSIRRLTLDPCNKRCDTLSSCFISCHCIILIHIVSAFGLSYVNLNCETRHTSYPPRILTLLVLSNEVPYPQQCTWTRHAALGDVSTVQRRPVAEGAAQGDATDQDFAKISEFSTSGYD